MAPVTEYKATYMADNPLSILDPLTNFFTGNLSTAGNLLINLIVSTVVMGIIFLIIVEIFGKKWGENVNAKNAFLVVFFINLLNIFGVIGIIGTYIAWIPYILLILPLLVWIIVLKGLFGGMSALHLVITAVVGYAVSIYVAPYFIALAWQFVPLPA